MLTGVCPPAMMVASGPLTLSTVTAVVSATRLLSDPPATIRPPVSYSPLVTHTRPPQPTHQSPPECWWPPWPNP